MIQNWTVGRPGNEATHQQSVYNIASFPGLQSQLILCRSFTRPSTALAVIEGLGTKLSTTHRNTHKGSTTAYSFILAISSSSISAVLLTVTGLDRVRLTRLGVCGMVSAVLEEFFWTLLPRSADGFLERNRGGVAVWNF